MRAAERAASVRRAAQSASTRVASCSCTSVPLGNCALYSLRRARDFVGLPASSAARASRRREISRASVSSEAGALLVLLLGETGGVSLAGAGTALTWRRDAAAGGAANAGALGSGGA